MSNSSTCHSQTAQPFGPKQETRLDMSDGSYVGHLHGLFLEPQSQQRSQSSAMEWLYCQAFLKMCIWKQQDLWSGSQAWAVGEYP